MMPCPTWLAKMPNMGAFATARKIAQGAAFLMRHSVCIDSIHHKEDRRARRKPRSASENRIKGQCGEPFDSDLFLKGSSSRLISLTQYFSRGESPMTSATCFVSGRTC